MENWAAEVALSALDAIDLGITVKAAALPPASDHLLQLQVGVDPRQLHLHNEKNRIQGGLDLVFLQKDSSGKFLAADKQHFDVNFNRKEYDALAKSGLILQRRLTIDPGSTEILACSYATLAPGHWVLSVCLWGNSSRSPVSAPSSPYNLLFLFALNKVGWPNTFQTVELASKTVPQGNCRRATSLRTSCLTE